MKKTSVVRAVAICAGIMLSCMAFAEWNLTWYCDPYPLAAPVITDNMAVPVVAGMPVYLLSAGADNVVQGVDNMGYVLGDDVVVSLYGSGYATATIGSLDFPWDPQVDGEFYRSQTIADSTAPNRNLYAIAFNAPVPYQAGSNRFYGSGWFGQSAVYAGTGAPSQVMALAGWSTGTQLLIPEPTTIALLGAGLAGIVAYRRKRLATV